MYINNKKRLTKQSYKMHYSYILKVYCRFYLHDDLGLDLK
jgi:hypothetical protein